mgnify:CR=1 FL=1
MTDIYMYMNNAMIEINEVCGRIVRKMDGELPGNEEEGRQKKREGRRGCHLTALTFIYAPNFSTTSTCHLSIN